MPTPMPTESEIDRKWYVVDADGKVLGRLATRIATILRGKHKPWYAPHVDVGDHVIVVNAEKVALTAVPTAMPVDPSAGLFAVTLAPMIGAATVKLQVTAPARAMPALLAIVLSSFAV